jgi:hypothetical protein
MPILHRDFETRSRASIKTVGAHRYAADPSTSVLCVCYAVDNGPVELWLPGQPVPQCFVDAANNPDWIVVAHNDRFESAIEMHVLHPRFGWPPVPAEQHVCTMAAAQACALPGALEKVAAALRLKWQKDKQGHLLMMQLCKEDGRPVDPEKLQRLCEYCRIDVEVERELHGVLPKLSDDEQRVWVLDQRINSRGFHVDTALARAARDRVRNAELDIGRRVTSMTRGTITSVHQVERIKEYVNARGHQMRTLGKRAVSAVLAHGPDEETRELLELRRDGAHAAAKKFDKLLVCADGDDRIRDGFRFCGSSTGRWSGSRFQSQNLRKAKAPEISGAVNAVLAGDTVPLATVAKSTRGAICAQPGHVLIGADFSAVESRVLAWLAGETWKLEVYREYDRTKDPTLEPYCVNATKILKRNKPVTPEDETARGVGKTGDLAFGFGGGLKAFRKFDSSDTHSDADVESFKRAWRGEHRATVQFWRALDSALKRAIVTRLPVMLGALKAECVNSNLTLALPNGRRLFYPAARVVPSKKFENATEISFMDNGRGKWIRKAEWFGTFVENCVQATSRDLLVAAMLRVEDAGFPIVSHCHDEVVCEVRREDADLERFHALVVTPPPWADGLPIAAKAWIAERYGMPVQEL